MKLKRKNRKERDFMWVLIVCNRCIKFKFNGWRGISELAGVIGAFYATSEPKLFSYSNRIGIRRVKIKGRGRDRSRVTLMLRVVEK